MKTMKLLPLLFLLALPVAVQAQFSYEIIDGTIAISGYTGPGGNVTIPSTCWINGLPVTIIGTSAFDSCQSLTSVTIPSSITNIWNSAFSDCFNLTNVTIPNSVTSIGDSAFYNCASLNSVIIPNNLTSIGNSYSMAAGA